LNSKQKKVLLFGIVVVALMILFPPWVYFDSDTSGRHSAGHHFFLAPPASKPSNEVFGPPRYPHMVLVRVNDFRLMLQLLITIPTFLGLMALLRSKSSVIGIGLGILFLGFALFVLAFIIWMVVDERLNYGRWQLP
jgi:hypothetical protein